MAVLVEYTPTLVHLDPTDVDFLLDIVKASLSLDEEARLLESLTPTHEHGVYQVRSGPYVGRLGLPSGDYLDFRSRFDFLDVIELIRVSGRLPIRRDGLTTPTDPRYSLIDVIADAFARELERIVGAGLAKGYLERRFDDPPYPGLLDATRHLSRFAARPDRLCTRAKRISRDIFVNQALLAGLQALQHIPLPVEVGQRLARLRPTFGDVRPTSISIEGIANVRLSQLTFRYGDALALAELILRAQSLAPTGAAHRGMSIVFSMPKVWERYVYLRIADEWPSDCDVVHGYPFELSPGGLSAEADVVVRKAGVVLALYDAKYKRIEDAPSRGDLYQMVTYCERLGLERATLVLPGAELHRAVRVGSRSIKIRGMPGPVSKERTAVVPHL